MVRQENLQEAPTEPCKLLAIFYKQAAPTELINCFNTGFLLQRSVLFIENRNIPVWAPSEPPFNASALGKLLFLLSFTKKISIFV